MTYRIYMDKAIPPVEKLTVSVYESIGGVDYLTFRENIVYTPNKVANDGIYTIDISPMPKYKKYNHMSTTTLYICRE